jgi:translocation and assembly module TamA
VGLAAAPAPAQDAPTPPRVTIVPTGEAALDALAEQVSQTLTLAERAPADGLGLLARARGDLPRLVDAMRAEGFYAGEAAVEINGEPPETPGLAERLDAGGAPVEIRFRLTPGPRYRIARLDILPEPAAAAEPLAAATARPFGIAVGDPARAAPVLDAPDEIIRRLRAAGRPLAALAGQRVVVDHDARTMEVTWRIAPGPEATYGPARIEGAPGVDPAMLARIADRRLASGPGTPDRLESARRALLGLQALSEVRATPATAPGPDGRIPVTFSLAERPRRAFGVAAAWETILGPTVSAYWEHRNVFGGAETFRLEGETTGIAERAPTWRLSARFRTPEFLERDIRTETTLRAASERLEAYDRDGIDLSVLFDHRWSERLTLRAGPAFSAGRIGRSGNLEPFQRIELALGVRYDDTDSALDPTRGWRAALAVTPALPFDDAGPFTRLRIDASTYFPLAAEGATVLALRAAAGTTFGAARDGLVLDTRFYAGGGGSVRGLPFQGVGPRDAQRRPLGGASLAEGSIELRHRLTETFGVVAFLDAGAVGAGALSGLSGIAFGAGLGVRYRTVIGPLRADIGVPLQRRGGDPAFGLYIGLGQAF